MLVTYLYLLYPGLEQMEWSRKSISGTLNSISYRCHLNIPGADLIFLILLFQLTEELDDGKHAAVRVGAATTNLQMLDWSNK